MRLYHFTTKKNAPKIIRGRQLKVSFANAVNDLFELKPFDFGRREVRQAWQKCIEGHAEKQGFISFAENWEAPTMWAHYAENHEGLCYGFDISAEQIYKIDYVKNLRLFDTKAFSDPIINRCMSDYASKIKSVHWEYEKEWRKYASLTDVEVKAKAAGETCFFVDFDEDLLLREVIIGAKSKITSSCIKNALRSSDDVQIQTARPSFREYKMVLQRNSAYQN